MAACVAAGDLDHPAVNLRSGGDHHLIALQDVRGYLAAKSRALLAAGGREIIQQPDVNGDARGKFAGAQGPRVHDVAVRVGGVGAFGQRRRLRRRGSIPLGRGHSAVGGSAAHGLIVGHDLGLDGRGFLYGPGLKRLGLRLYLILGGYG